MSFDLPHTKKIKLNNGGPPEELILYKHKEGDPDVQEYERDGVMLGWYEDPPYKAFRINTEGLRIVPLKVLPLHGHTVITPTFYGNLSLIITVPEGKRLMDINFVDNNERKEVSYIPVLILTQDGENLLGIKYKDDYYVVEQSSQKLFLTPVGEINYSDHNGHDAINVEIYPNIDTVILKYKDNSGILCKRYKPPERGADEPSEYIPYQY